MVDQWLGPVMSIDRSSRSICLTTWMSNLLFKAFTNMAIGSSGGVVVVVVVEFGLGDCVVL